MFKMVVVAQLVRALVCGTRGRRFEPGLPPKEPFRNEGLFLCEKFKGIIKLRARSLC